MPFSARRGSASTLSNRPPFKRRTCGRRIKVEVLGEEDQDAAHQERRDRLMCGPSLRRFSRSMKRRHVPATGVRCGPFRTRDVEEIAQLGEEELVIGPLGRT
jgi:hypothetical protein